MLMRGQRRDAGCMPCQEERSEQLRSLSFLAGVLDGFAMSSLLQLNFSITQIQDFTQCCYAFSLGITVRQLQALS